MIRRGIAYGDTHCGHLVGLTPPPWQTKSTPKSATKRNKYHEISKDLWREFASIIKKLPKLDFVIINGDNVDGKGKRSGGTELVTTDMFEQCAMAVHISDYVRRTACKKKATFVGTFGTPYHTDVVGDEFEKNVAMEAGWDKIGAHEWVEVNGCVFDVKHHLGSSTVPHGRHTATSKDMLWNSLWALSELQPRSQVFLRSHVHYHQFCGDVNKVGMTLPALQGMGSKFGAKRCSGLVHWGLVYFEIDDKGNCDWSSHITTIKSQKAKVVKV